MNCLRMCVLSACFFTLFSPLFSPLCGVLAVQDIDDLTDKAYRRFLETNIASFADAHYDRLMCPEDLSLIYRSDLLSGCEANSTQSSDISEHRVSYLTESKRFSSWFPPLSMNSSDLPPLKSYWPLHKEILRSNQRLMVLGITGEEPDEQQLKTNFYSVIAVIQNTLFPVAPDHMHIIFDGEKSLLDQLIETCGLLNQSMVEQGSHVPEPNIQDEISEHITDALDLIKEIDVQLYQALHKVIAVITIYEVDAKTDINIAGSFLNLIGLIWLNPNVEWTTPLIAENIIHESIHNALYLAEMVHGTVTDREASDDVTTTSAIRVEPRPFSKSLHAAYVSAGLCFFHLHALKTPHIPHDEHLSRLLELFSTLPASVDEMVDVQIDTAVLSPSGEIILKHLLELVTLLKPHVEKYDQQSKEQNSSESDDI